MPFTKCPNCRKVQQVVPKLLTTNIGCMNARCGTTFKAHEYYMHSGVLSRGVFYFVIAFSIYLLFRWIWNNSHIIFSQLG
jgi:hypothetical protein